MGWVKMQHKKEPRIQYWVELSEPVTNEHGTHWVWKTKAGEVEIRATKNAFYDSEEMPPARSLPGGTFPLTAIKELYEPVP